MDESTPARGRWFRFSLATLFVVVTLTGTVLGLTLHSLRWIDQRSEVLDRCGFSRHGVTAPNAPLVLRIFDEWGVEYLIVPMDCGPNANPDAPLSNYQLQEYDRIKRLFPETSDISYYVDDYTERGWDNDEQAIPCNPPSAQ